MRNFIIVGTQRTGSSALGEAIGLHQDVTCGWEWTERVGRAKKLDIAQQALNGDFSGLLPHDREHMTRVYRPENNWLGFRRLFGASNLWVMHPRYSLKLWVDRFEDHLQWFRSRSDIHIIHIVRRDNINWLKSKFMAKKSKSFVGKPYPEDMKVKVPITEAVARLKSKDWIDMNLAMLSSTNPYKKIIYEDLLEDNSAIVTGVLDFLGCDSVAVSNKKREVQAQSKGSAANYIANYDQLMAALDKLNLVNSGYA